MINRTFWLGLGIGLIVTSLLLGLTSAKPTANGNETDRDLATTDEKLRQMVEERGFQLVSQAEYAKLTKEQANAGEEGLKPDSGNKKIYLYIPSGFSWKQTAEILKEAQIVERTNDVMKQLKDLGKEQQLQPGLYTFEEDEKPKDIVKKLSSP